MRTSHASAVGLIIAVLFSALCWTHGAAAQVSQVDTDIWEIVRIWDFESETPELQDGEIIPGAGLHGSHGAQRTFTGAFNQINLRLKAPVVVTELMAIRFDYRVDSDDKVQHTRVVVYSDDGGRREEQDFGKPLGEWHTAELFILDLRPPPPSSVHHGKLPLIEEGSELVRIRIHARGADESVTSTLTIDNVMLIQPKM